MKGLIGLLIAFLLPLQSFTQDVVTQVNETPGVAVVNDEADAAMETFSSAPRGWFNSKESVYSLKPAVDIPIIVAGTAWSAYAFGKIYAKDKIPAETVGGLKKENLNALDRWAAGKSSPKMDANSNYLFYGSIPLPALLFLDRKIRKDAGRIAIMYWESFAITGMFYTGSAYFIDRYRLKPMRRNYR